MSIQTTAQDFACELNSSGTKNATLRLIAFAALVLFEWRSCIQAAEFHSITPAAVAPLSPYKLHRPIVVFTAISGDGHTIAGQVIETGVDYDCARNNCEVSPFTWSLDNPSARRVVTEGSLLTFQSQTSRWPALRINALTHDGTGSLLVSEYRHYETAIEREGQTQLLRPVIDSSDWLWATGISANGNIVVGDLGPGPFRWDETSGLQLIRELPSNHPFTATAVSGDGGVIVLNAFPGVASRHLNLGGNQTIGNAYRWAASAGLQELPPLAGDTYSYAVAPSFDGATIVGNSVLITEQKVFLNRAVRWDGDSRTQLAGLVGFSWSIAHDVSGDGRLAVGAVYNQPPGLWAGPWFEAGLGTSIGFNQPIAGYFKAALWDGNGNAFDLKDLLASKHGLAAQLEGWTLTGASAISDDGLIIVGSGIDPQGVHAIWIASLAVPEPSAAGMLAVLLLLGSNAGRVRRRG